MNLPANQYDDCRDNGCKEDKPAEHTECNYSAKIQFRLMRARRSIHPVHSEGPRGLGDARTRPSLCIVHSTPGDLVVLRMIAVLLRVIATIADNHRWPLIQSNGLLLANCLAHGGWHLRHRLMPVVVGATRCNCTGRHGNDRRRRRSHPRWQERTTTGTRQIRRHAGWQCCCHS